MFQEHEQNRVIDGTGLANVSRRTGTLSVPRMASLPVVAQSSLPVKRVAPALHEHLAEKAMKISKAEVRQQKRKKRREAIANFFETLADAGETIIKTD